MRSEDPDDAIRSVYRALATSARRSNLARAEVIEDALRARTEQRLTPEQRTAAAAAAHQVVGSAGTFGHSRASVLAASLEQWLRCDDATAGHGPADRNVGDDGLARARAELEELCADLRQPHQDEE